MPDLITHTGGFTSDPGDTPWVWEGAITGLADAVAPIQVGLTMTGGTIDASGATIGFTGGVARLPANGAFDPDATYGFAVSNGQTATYTITGGTGVPDTGGLQMTATVRHGIRVGRTHYSKSVLDGTNPRSIAVPSGATAGDQLLFAIGSERHGDENDAGPTMPGWTQLARVDQSRSPNAGWRTLIVWTKSYESESSVTITLPTGWYGGGPLSANRCAMVLQLWRDVTAPTVSTTDAAASGTVDSPVSEGILTALAFESTAIVSPWPWFGTSITPGMTELQRSDAVTLGPSPSSTQPVAVMGMAAGLTTIRVSDRLRQVGGWQLGSVGWGPA